MEKKARNYLLRLLARRDYPSSVLKRKCSEKGYPTDEAEAAIAEMERLGYVKDDLYLEKAVERELGRGHGPRAIAFKLSRLGLPRDSLQKEIARICTPKKQIEQIRRLIAKSHKKELRNQIASLLRRGFEMGTINAALRESGHSFYIQDFS